MAADSHTSAAGNFCHLRIVSNTKSYQPFKDKAKDHSRGQGQGLGLQGQGQGLDASRPRTRILALRTNITAITSCRQAVSSKSWVETGKPRNALDPRSWSCSFSWSLAEGQDVGDQNYHNCLVGLTGSDRHAACSMYLL